MSLNPQQQAALSHCITPGPSLNLIARAGTGKTFTLIAIAGAIPGRAFLGAFNRAIADELRSRLPQRRGLDANTMHGAGLGAWRRQNPQVKVDGDKITGMYRTVLADSFRKGKALIVDHKIVTAANQLIGYAKQSGYGLDLPYEDADAWEQLIDYYDLEDDIPNTIARSLFLETCITTYEKSLQECRNVVDFNDMLLAPLYYRTPLPRYDWFLMDEAQDTNEVRRRLAVGMIGGRLGKGRMIAVGDPKQCQPAGTLVTLAGGEQIPIEYLATGDKVVSYARRDGCYYNNGQAITAIKARPYSGRLICVSVYQNGLPRTTKVTPNHKFLVRWTDRSHEKWATYIMRKGDAFRVGWCQLFERTCKTFHFSLRTRLEGADASWIVAVHDTKQAASMHESYLAARYGLPLLTFKEINGSNLYTQIALDAFWSNAVTEINLAKRATKLLTDYGRDIDYPFFAAGTYKKRGRTTLFEVQACNLIEGMMCVPLYTGVKEPDWAPIHLREEQYTGPVYSMDVDKYHTYVADSILTCNSIYGFAGASNDAMGVIQREMRSAELPLSVTYRCPKRVVELAQTWVPDYTAHPDAPEGTVRELHHSDLWTERFNPDTDVILCRFTRPLAGIASNLRDRGIPCIIEGQSAKALLSLATKWGDIHMDEFRTRLEEYRAKKTAEWAVKDRPDKAAAVEDRVGSVKAFAMRISATQTTRELVRQIEMVFREQDRRGVLTLCTVHRSKGREWDRVYLIGRNDYMPCPWASQEWEQEQEENLIYVAVTRTKRELVEVVVPSTVDEVGRRMKPDRDWWDLTGGEE